MKSVTPNRIPKSLKIKRAKPEQQPLMIVKWVRFARKRCIPFHRFVVAVRPFIQSAPTWYSDLEKLWESAAPK